MMKVIPSVRNFILFLIIYLNFSLITYAGGICYSFEDSKCPIPNGSYKIISMGQNHCLEFGHNARTKNQIRLNLDSSASISFKWHYSRNEDSGKYVFLIPSDGEPIEYNSNEQNSTWEQVTVDNIPRGEVKWLLTKLDDIGYLDDLCIKYNGCAITKFNIIPEACFDSGDKNKKIYIELYNNGAINNARLELVVPREAKVYDFSRSGFLSGASLQQDGDRISIIQPKSINSDHAEIVMSLSNIPYGRYTIEIIKLTINGIDQHKSLYNCKWAINSNINCVTAEKLEGYE